MAHKLTMVEANRAAATKDKNQPSPAPQKPALNTPLSDPQNSVITGISFTGGMFIELLKEEGRAMRRYRGAANVSSVPPRPPTRPNVLRRGQTIEANAQATRRIVRKKAIAIMRSVSPNTPGKMEGSP